MVEPAAALKGSKWFSWRAQSNDANLPPPITNLWGLWRTYIQAWKGDQMGYN